jgi:LAO/AO transport system kinase
MGITKSENKIKSDPLLENFFAGNRVALARMISRAENGHSITDPLLDQIFKKMKGAYRIGITGPPGAGKSTLVDGLVTKYRKKNKTVGVIAIDPTSPFTGGALLGDRIRMNSNQGDPNVFIRSMATRGSLGGLAHSTQETADVMDAFGFDIVIMETVGVGQSELDIVEAADSVVVVLVPESGDSIQAMKAGLMEIGDIFVLNKSDHENAEQAFGELSSILSLKPKKDDWKLPILKTVANQTKGLTELIDTLTIHRKYLDEEKRLQKKRRDRIRKRLYMKIEHKLQIDFWNENKKNHFNKLVIQLFNGNITYKQALKELF